MVVEGRDTIWGGGAGAQNAQRTTLLGALHTRFFDANPDMDSIPRILRAFGHHARGVREWLLLMLEGVAWLCVNP